MKLRGKALSKIKMDDFDCVICGKTAPRICKSSAYLKNYRAYLFR